MRKVAALVALLFVSIFGAASHSYGSYPYFQVESTIWPQGASAGAAFGTAVDTDGERIIVGAPGQGNGAVFIYARDGAHWLEEARIEAPSGPAGQEFGAAVAIAGDLAYVGVPGHSGGLLSEQTGRVDLLERSNGAWRVAGSMQCPDAGRGDRCGAAVSAVPGYVFVGAPGLPDVQRTEAGRVFVMRADGTELQTLQPSSSIGRQFGAAIDASGDRLIIGAPARTGTDVAAAGQVYFYDRLGASLFARGMDAAPTSVGAPMTYGANVAIDGNDAVVTTVPQYDNQVGFYVSGDAIFYGRSGATWSVVDSYLADLDSVALRNGTALVGAWYWDTIYVMQKTPQYGWDVVGYLGDFWSGVEGRTEEFAASLAYDGRVVALGSPLEAQPGKQTGAAFAYYDNWPPWAYAGGDQVIDDVDDDGVERVRLDGNRSGDPDGEIVSHTWLLAGDVLATEPVVDVDLPLGVHVVRLDVTDDLGGTSSDTVRIEVRTPTTEARFRWNPTNPWVRGWTSFIDDSSDLRSPIRHWDWDFNGDGRTDSTARHPHHIFESAGPQTVRLTTTNQDGDTLVAQRVVQVRGGWPTADAGDSRIVKDTDRNLVETFTLDGSKSHSDAGIVAWEWWGGLQDSGEPTMEDTQALGVHRYQLFIEDGDGYWAADETTVIVASPDGNATASTIQPDFTVDQTWGRYHRFVDATKDSGSDRAAAWLWDFDGDGKVDAEGERVNHEFDAPGEHVVRLRVLTEQGFSPTVDRAIRVNNEPPSAYFWPQFHTVPQGAYVIFQGTPWDEGEIRSWEWSMSDGMTSDHADFGRTFDEIGEVDIVLTVVDDGGLQDTQEGLITVIDASEWESIYGEFDPEDLEPPPAEPPVDAAPPPATEPPPVTVETSEPQSRPATAETPNPEWYGVPLWIWIVLGSLLLVVPLIVVPASRR